MSAIVAGATVTVHEPRGDWVGWVNQMPDGPYERGEPMPPAVVAVVDPIGSGLRAHTVWSVPVRRLGCMHYATAPEPKWVTR